MSHPSYADTTKSGPESSPIPQSQQKSSAPSRSGSIDDQSKSTPGSTSKSVQDSKKGVYGSIHNPSTKTAAPVSEVVAVRVESVDSTSEAWTDNDSTLTQDEIENRPSTPISQITQTPAEQITPRSEAGKRVSKFDAEKYMRQALPRDVLVFMEASKWCLICTEDDHLTKECNERWLEPAEDDVKNIINSTRFYIQEKKKERNKNKSTRSSSRQVFSSTSAPMATDSYASFPSSTKKTKK
jgi:hypothetical protein